MSKELTPLETLYKLEMRAVSDKNTTVAECEKLRDIIGKALNDNHLYKYIINKICEYLGLDMKSHRDLIETENEILNTLITYEIKLKAFEIIKEKQVDVGRFILVINAWFDDDFALHRYNDYLENDLPKWKLTQEEFDLLKEVFFK